MARLKGLYWDPAESRPRLTDDADVKAIRALDGGDSFDMAYILPTVEEGQRKAVGQLTRGEDGNPYTTRFGVGSYGSMVAVPPSGPSCHLTGLDGARRRISIAPTADGQLVVGWLRGGGQSAQDTISEVTPADGGQASEQTLILGPGTRTGLAVVGDQVFVSDQEAGVILAYALPAVRAQAAAVAEGQLVAQFTTSDDLIS